MFYGADILKWLADHVNTRQLSRLFYIVVCLLDAHLKDHLVLTLVQRNEELGFAVLECAHDHAYIETYQGDVQVMKDGDEDLILAFGIEREEPLFGRVLAYTKASSIVLSGNNTHLLFACETFAGNSCAAVVLKEDTLAGIYLAGVNALCERLQQVKASGARLTAAEESIGVVLNKGPQQGHCALLSHVFSN